MWFKSAVLWYVNESLWWYLTSNITMIQRTVMLMNLENNTLHACITKVRSCSVLMDPHFPAIHTVMFNFRVSRLRTMVSTALAHLQEVQKMGSRTQVVLRPEALRKRREAPLLQNLAVHLPLAQSKNPRRVQANRPRADLVQQDRPGGRRAHSMQRTFREVNVRLVTGANHHHQQRNAK